MLLLTLPANAALLSIKALSASFQGALDGRSRAPICETCHRNSSLPVPDLTALQADMERVTFGPDDVLSRARSRHSFVCFPTTGMLTERYVGEHLASPFWLIGRQGVAGLADALVGGGDGAEISGLQAGAAYRLSSDVFRRIALSRPAIMRASLTLLAAETRALHQRAFCASHHDLKQRLAGWLVAACPAGEGSRVEIRQSDLAAILGMVRTSVTACAQTFKQAGLIDYSRGFLTVLDRPGLAAIACACPVQMPSAARRRPELDKSHMRTGTTAET